MRIYQYLGTFTNFWELKVREKAGDKEEYVLRWVIARIPKLKTTDDLAFKIIEESFDLLPIAQKSAEPSPEATG
jgi:hypothetical protein